MDLKEAIRHIAGNQRVYPLLCQIKAINDDKTVDVEPVDQPEFYGIRLTAEINPTEGIIAVPAVGSMVFVMPFNSETGFVVIASALESWTCKIDNAEARINKDGLKLTVNGSDFKEGMSDLKTALEQMTVNTAVGVSSVPTNISAISQALEKILNCLQ